MGILDVRAMRFVTDKMQAQTQEVEKRFDTFIDNQNELIDAVAEVYALLKQMAVKTGIPEAELVKPKVNMEVEGK